jgi:hypothetical protein
LGGEKGTNTDFYFYFLRSYLGTGMGGDSGTKPDFFKDTLSHAQPEFFFQLLFSIRMLSRHAQP